MDKQIKARVVEVMKITFEASKRSRILKYNFLGVVVEHPEEDYWFYEDSKIWSIHSETLDEIYSNTDRNVKSFNAFKRYVKKHSIYLPKGTIFRLISRYVGFDIYCEI